MNDKVYSLKELIHTFSEHAIRAEQNKLEWQENFKKSNPEQPMPKELEDDFNLPLALKSICLELLNKKDFWNE